MSAVTRLRTGRLGVPIPAGRRDVVSSPKRPDRSGAQSAPYSMVTRRGLGAGRLLPFSADVKNEWRCNSTPPLHGAYRDNFNFNFSESSGEVTNQY